MSSCLKDSSSSLLDALGTVILFIKKLGLKSYIRFARLLATGVATVSLIGSSLGVGVIFAGFLRALARNPELERILFQYTLLGFALCEAIGVAGLGIVFMLFFGDS